MRFQQVRFGVLKDRIVLPSSVTAENNPEAMEEIDDAVSSPSHDEDKETA